jgi:hypothetical protein
MTRHVLFALGSVTAVCTVAVFMRGVEVLAASATTTTDPVLPAAIAAVVIAGALVSVTAIALASSLHIAEVSGA